MKNTWVHSLVLALLFSGALVLARAASHSLMGMLGRMSDVDTLALLTPSLSTLAQLVPGLALGWFTRRHPLLVGALAALLAGIPVLFLAYATGHLAVAAGGLVSTLLIVAVAALAGRALRWRFRPPSAEAAA